MASKSRNPIVAQSRLRRAALEALERRWLFAAGPSVNNVTPANGATGVALNAPITATVNLPNGGLNPNTVIGANVMLFPTGNNSNAADVPAVVNTTGGGDAIILTPSVNLQLNTQYTFSVSAGVKDVNGDPITPFSESFTTGNTAPPVNQTIAFSKTVLGTTSGTPFTDMHFGPDGRLYASTEDGRIFRYPVNNDGTLGTPQVISSLQAANNGNRLISGFAFDPAATAANPIIWVSNTFYALSGASNGVNFTGKLTVMSGANLENVKDAIIDLPRSVADHVNDQPVFQPGTTNLFFCQAGQNAYGAPDTTWGNRPETELSAAILEVKTNLLNLNGPAVNVLTPDAKSDAGVALGGTYDPTAPGAPVTIYATGIRNAFTLLFDASGQLWAPANGSSSGGNTPAGGGAPALTNVQQVEVDSLFKVQAGAYYGHPNPIRNQFVLDDGNPTSGGIPGVVFSAYPSGTNPDPNYQPPNYIFGVHNSPDGMIQYTGSAFGGALDGKFLVSEESAGDDIVVLSTDSNDDIIGGRVSTATGAGPDRTVSGFSGFSNPVTLIENPATGFIYVSELGATKMTLLKPTTVAPTISVSTSAVAFNTIATGNTGAGPSRVETVTITNTGANALALGSGAFSIVNNPASATQDAGDFAISNLGSLPGSLAFGQSTTVQLKYTATAVGIQSAILQITSAGASTPTVNVTLNGIGTAGQFGYLEPSLVQVLRANNIPTIVGAGPNDSDINNPTYPETPDPSSQEVPMQQLTVAGPGPVTITTLASFNNNSTPSLRFGYYTSGDPNSTHELFTVSKADAQTVYPTAVGATSFNPGSGPFGLYGIFPGVTVTGGGTDIHYSEDALNTALDPANPRKFRFFPLKNSDGSVVPNAFIVAAEDFNGTMFNSFVNFVGIIRNVTAAPSAINSAQIGVVNLSGVVGSNQLAFSRIQIPNPTVADVVHDSNVIRISNTGAQPLAINSLTLSDTTNWTLVNPPTLPMTIPAGGSINVTIKFIAQTVPPVTANETNTTATTNGVPVTKAGGVWNGTLTINSTDPVTPAKVLKLAGYWQDQSEHENEPGLSTILNLLYGYNTDVSSNTTTFPIYSNSGTTAVYYDSEVVSGLWNVADPTQPVSVTSLASYHGQYDTATPPNLTPAAIGYYLSGSGTTTFLNKQVANSSQTLLPPLTQDGANPLATSFSPSGTFGINADGEKSQDNLNTTDISTYGRSGHAIRFFPLVDANKNIVPNTWVVAMDYQNGPKANADYQDNVWIFSNMAPAAGPASPNDLQVFQGPAGVTVQWAPANGAVSYNLLRSVNGGAYNQVNSGPINGTSFVDVTAPSGTNISYELLAVNSAKVASYPTIASIALSVSSTIVPPAPTNVQGTGSTVAMTSQISLTWTASTGAASYIVQRKGPSDANFVTLTSIDTVNSFTDTTVVAGAAYSYQIAASNPSGSSAFTAAGPFTAPVPVLPGTPTTVTADGTSGSQVVVSWTAAANDSTFDVLRQGPGDSTFVVVASGLTATVYNDTNVTPGATYMYEVDSANSTATSAPSAPPVTVTVAITSTPPQPPTGLGADASSGVHVLVTWNLSSGATSYSVSRLGPSDTVFVPIATNLTLPTFTDTMVSVGSTYMYEVNAVNTAGASAFSAPTSVVIPPPPPTAPTNVKADGSTSSQVVITWDPDPSATTFNVDRQSSPGGAFLQIANNLTADTFTDTLVTAGSSYAYRVDAVNSSGATASSPTSVTVAQPKAALDITVGKGANKSVQFTAANGTVTTISLSGSGTAIVHFVADSISQASGKAGVVVSGANIAVGSISITGASLASMLKMTTKGGGVSVGRISSDAALGGINAKSVILIGDLTVAGATKKIVLSSASSSTITVGGSLAALQLGSANGVAVTSAGPIKSITAGTWNSTSAISAPSVGAIVIKGDASFGLNVGTVHSIKVGGVLSNSTFTLTAAGTLDLATLSAGQLSGATIDAIGNIGSISAGIMTDSSIEAGVGVLGAGKTLPSAASDFTSNSAIASVKLKKGAASFVNSTIAASFIKSLVLADVTFPNNGNPFGVAATDISALSGVNPATGKPFTFKKLTSQSIVTADLASAGITPGDFVIRIV